MRVYVAASRADLEALAAGGVIEGARVIPDSEEEQAEFEAFSEAAAGAVVVVAADVVGADGPVTLAEVASFHVDLDGTGDLAWFATQEMDAVLLAFDDRVREERRPRDS